jgi:hypothetical protein
MRPGWCCIVVLAACFAEAPDLADGTTGGRDCPIGSKGCPCTNGGACDAPLECHQQSQNCYDPDCDAGSKDCPCADGLCLGDLQCIDGYCVEASSGSTGGVSTTSTMTSDASDTTTGTYTTTVADTTVSGSSTEATMTTTVGSSSTVSTTVETGSPPPCEECLLMQSYPCATTYGACMNTPECAMGLDCIEQGNAAATCCAVIGNAASMWNAWVSCAEAQCTTECEGILLQCPLKV